MKQFLAWVGLVIVFDAVTIVVVQAVVQPVTVLSEDVPRPTGYGSTPTFCCLTPCPDHGPASDGTCYEQGEEESSGIFDAAQLETQRELSRAACAQALRQSMGNMTLDQLSDLQLQRCAYSEPRRDSI